MFGYHDLTIAEPCLRLLWSILVEAGRHSGTYTVPGVRRGEPALMTNRPSRSEA